MTRRAPLAIIEANAVSSGLTPDRHLILQTLWETAENVRFYQGKVRRLIPPAVLAEMDDALRQCRGLHQQQNSDGVRWVFAAWVLIDTLYVSRWYAPAFDYIYGASGIVTEHDTSQYKASMIDFTQWGDWTLWLQGEPLTTPRRYKPDTDIVDALPGAPIGLAMFKKQNHLVIIGTGASRRGVAWSDADDIENWAAATDNTAGSLTIEELRTPIRGGARLGQNIACYSEDQMALVYWTGAPFYYGQRVALDGIGITGKAAVCADGRLNYGISRNGLWQTDGTDFRYIDHGKLSDYLQERVNWDQSGKCVAFRNDVTRCIEFHLPLDANTENSEAWSFDPSTGDWGKVTAYHYGMERVLFDKPLVGKDGFVYLLDDNPAVAAALNLKTKPLMIDTPDYPGLHVDARIDEVELAAKVATGVEFRLGNATDIDGPYEYTAWQTFTSDLKTYRMPHLPTGTYHVLEFRSTVTNWALDLQGIALFGFVEGTKRDTL